MEWQLSVVSIAECRRPVALPQLGRESSHYQLCMESVAESTQWGTDVAALETWIVGPDGKVFWHVENDGPAVPRRGIKPRDYDSKDDITSSLVIA
jgi:hypothetical protein